MTFQLPYTPRGSRRHPDRETQTERESEGGWGVTAESGWGITKDEREGRGELQYGQERE